MSSYSFELPLDFDQYEPAVETNGWFDGSLLTVSGKRYHLIFYEPMRLMQEVESELERAAMFLEPNLIVIPSVTRSNMERAVEVVVRSRWPTNS